MDESPLLSHGERRVRCFELVLVFGSVFGSSLLLSLYVVATATALPYGFNPALQIAEGIISELFGLALLVYVLKRRNETLLELGLTFRWRDLLPAIALVAVGYAAAWLVYTGLAYGWYFATGHALLARQKNVEFFQASSKGEMLFLSIPFIIVNPFAEELIARAYVMREVRSLTGSSVTAICVSAGLQATYHLYQGAVPALAYLGMFTVFSIYYARTRRIFPVILAHLFFDGAALVSAHMQ